MKQKMGRLNQNKENNPNWKGDNVGYSALHRWIRRHKGTPNYCEHCKSTTEKRYEWASISRKPSRDLDNYIRLCNRCHHIFDNQWERMRATRIKDGSFKFYGNQYKLSITEMVNDIKGHKTN